jgi:circadian clock protein KaiC
VVLDSLSELQLLAESPLRYRRQVLALKQYLSSRNCTIFLDDRTALSTDLQVRSVAHAVLTLELVDQAYGAERRRLRVVKYRGVPFRGGAHDYKILRGGLYVYPRLVAADAREQPASATVQRHAGARRAARRRPRRRHEHLDFRSVRHRQVVAGGAVRACRHPARRTLRHVPVRGRAPICSGQPGAAPGGPSRRTCLTVQQIDPAELSPGEFSSAVMHAVDSGARWSSSTA